MLYQFLLQDGTVRDADFPMDEAPAIDSYVELEDGVVGKRLPPVVQPTGKTFKPFTSNFFADYDPDVPHHAPDGRARFENVHEVQAVLAKKADKGDPIMWDVGATKPRKNKEW